MELPLNPLKLLFLPVTLTARAFRKKPRIEHGPSSRNRFAAAVSRVNGSPFYKIDETADSPYGTFCGRHIIGESTKINGGVYVGVMPQEALVIDETHGVLDEVYQELMFQFVRCEGNKENIEEKIFPMVIQFVRQKIRYNPKDIESYVSRTRIEPDTKTSLDIFVRLRSGCARHQVLLAAFLLEKLKSRGLIAGAFSIDQTFEALPADDERLIYLSPAGSAQIFDPASLNQVLIKEDSPTATLQ